MRAGILKQRITIEVKTTVKETEYGTQLLQWLPIIDGSRIPAQVQDVLPSKSEAVQQGIRVATSPARVRIRHRSDITSDMRVVVHGSIDKICQIIGGPAEIGRRELLEMVIEDYSS